MISGILVMVTSSGVNNTALMICKASFFAPCGMISPFSFLPPLTSNECMYIWLNRLFVQIIPNVIISQSIYSDIIPRVISNDDSTKLWLRFGSKTIAKSYYKKNARLNGRTGLTRKPNQPIN